MLFGAHCTPASKPLQTKIIGSLRPLVDEEVSEAEACPLGPTMVVVGLTLKEKLRSRVGTLLPSVVLSR
jgi:hypothetical protein